MRSPALENRLCVLQRRPLVQPTPRAESLRQKGSAEEGGTLRSRICWIARPTLSPVSSFATDEARMMYVLMDLREEILKQWGQYYLNKLLAGDQDPLLDSWQAFESGFLANWFDPAALQVAERRINQLKKTALASDYATEFRVIVGELEWTDSALMAAFRRGLKPFQRSAASSLNILVDVPSPPLTYHHLP
ncbi:Retrotransposon-derived protein PEG10 [Ceratobasidium sp. AG-Ba]|nr:Retrotransposon-derived protein PEG10 [Ceratobasidium sp. AG-Ba]